MCIDQMRPWLPIFLGIHVKITCLQGFYQFQQFSKRRSLLICRTIFINTVLLQLTKYGKLPTIVVPIGVMQTHVGHSPLHCILTITLPSGLIVSLDRGTKYRGKQAMAYWSADVRSPTRNTSTCYSNCTTMTARVTTILPLITTRR